MNTEYLSDNYVEETLVNVIARKPVHGGAQ